MALAVTHTFVSGIADDAANPQWVRPSNWNAAHTLTGAASIAQGGTGATSFANTQVVFAGVSSLSSDSGFTYLGNGQATLSLGNMTSDLTALRIAGTWNNSSVQFTRIFEIDITNTAASGSGTACTWAMYTVGGQTHVAMGLQDTTFKYDGIWGGLAGAAPGFNTWWLATDGLRAVYNTPHTGAAGITGNEFHGFYFANSFTGSFQFCHNITGGPPAFKLILSSGMGLFWDTANSGATADVSSNYDISLHRNAAGVLEVDAGNESNFQLGSVYANLAAQPQGLSTTGTVSSITIANPAVITLTAPHGCVPGQGVNFTTTGALPGDGANGINAGTTYYLIATGISATAFQLVQGYSNAANGYKVVTTLGQTQSGTHTAHFTNTQFALNSNTLANIQPFPIIVPGASGVTGSSTAAGTTIQQSWNTTGVVDAVLVVNAINVASGALSKVFDCQVNGTSQYAVDKTGIHYFNSASSFSANGAVATVLGSIGPTGSHTTVQTWLTFVDNGGATRYVPCF